MAYAATPSQIADALDWLVDCDFPDLPEDITPREIVEGVGRHYEGGWPQFLTDAGH
jgi:hypothetical protein